MKPLDIRIEEPAPEGRLDKALIILNVVCRICDVTHELQVRPEDVEKWIDGKLAQEAFPYLSPEERELLISQICEKCYGNLLGDEE